MGCASCLRLEKRCSHSVDGEKFTKNPSERSRGTPNKSSIVGEEIVGKEKRIRNKTINEKSEISESGEAAEGKEVLIHKPGGRMNAGARLVFSSESQSDDEAHETPLSMSVQKYAKSGHILSIDEAAPPSKKSRIMDIREVLANFEGSEHLGGSQRDSPRLERSEVAGQSSGMRTQTPERTAVLSRSSYQPLDASDHRNVYLPTLFEGSSSTFPFKYVVLNLKFTLNT